MILFILVDCRRHGIVFCRSPQGTPLLDLSVQNFDYVITTFNYHRCIIRRPKSVQASFDKLMAVYNLQNFQRIILDRHLLPHAIYCVPFGHVRTFDHEAALANIRWIKDTQGGVKHSYVVEMGVCWLDRTQRKDILQGDIYQQVYCYTFTLLKLKDWFFYHTPLTQWNRMISHGLIICAKTPQRKTSSIDSI